MLNPGVVVEAFVEKGAAMYFVPGFLVPVAVSVGLSILFLWNGLSKDEEGFPSPQGWAQWARRSPP